MHYYQRNDYVKTSLMPDGHVVLFNTKTNWAQVLNPVGGLVWEYCDGTTAVTEMVDEIARLLQVDKIALNEDINSLLSEFVSLGLISPVAASNP